MKKTTQTEGNIMPQMTIKDIARKAGVSTATVSRVINGTGNVNEAMKLRVQSVIDASGFKPNFSARSLKVNRTFTIGLILSDISDRYYSLMTKAVADELTASDYSLIVCNTDNLPEKEKWYFDFLSSKHVDGIILNTSGGIDDEIYRFSHDTPVVLVNRRIADRSDAKARIDFIGSDDIQGTITMTNLLLKNGHSRIGILNGDLSVSSGRDRLQGFRQSMKSAGINTEENYPYIYINKFDTATGYHGMQYLFGCSPAPTAVLTMNDSITIGALKYCRENHISIPDKLSLIAYGDVDNSELFIVTPTCISLAPHTIGQKAVQCLLERINTPAMRSREIIFASSLAHGNSISFLCE